MPAMKTKRVTEEEWERHKPDLRKMFLVQKMSLKELVQEMYRRGHTVTFVFSPVLAFDACCSC